MGPSLPIARKPYLESGHARGGDSSEQRRRGGGVKAAAKREMKGYAVGASCASRNLITAASVAS